MKKIILRIIGEILMLFLKLLLLVTGNSGKDNKTNGLQSKTEPLTTPKIKCSEIKEYFNTIETNIAWDDYIKWVETLSPLWVGLIEKTAELLDTPPEKVEKFKSVISTAFENLNDWWYEKKPLVKVRRKEIDSAISFIFQNARNNLIKDYLISVISLNLTSILRSTLTISVHGYRKENINLILAKNLCSMGEVRTFFKFETNNFISYLPYGKGLDGSSKEYSEDNYHLMMSIGAEKLKCVEDIVSINNEVFKIWTSFKNPIELKIPDDIWIRKIGNLNSQLYKKNRDDFYNR
ncbi:hypothetical protein [Geofilum rhodophaeum]|uniref:hypothetical protein n=1 Tax=Geofilum rhodophaeum TaxID=1965019 RepID=UPI000B521018|nr:hypothetical protein [Geofilum rhodophaeum]